MRKFTSNKINESNLTDITLRSSIHKLIDSYLKIGIYGPIDPILEGTIRIEGREEFISAILSMFTEDEINEKIKLLENSKFLGIDNMIDNLELKLEKQSPSDYKKHDKRIGDLIRNSNNDMNKLIELTERQADKIKSGEKAFYRSLAAERLGSDKYYKKVAEIFLLRSKKLGYRK
jgi:hypothetical protein